MATNYSLNVATKQAMVIFSANGLLAELLRVLLWFFPVVHRTSIHENAN